MGINIAGYQIGKLIHQSALTAVYSAVCEADGSKVVIKTLRAEYPQSRDVNRIRREFEISKKLSPIAEVLDLRSLEKHGNRNLAIVMQPFGISLADFLASNGRKPIEMDWFLGFAIRLARAVGAIHRGGVVHKDINPRNVLLDTSSGKVKLIDFGISSELSRERQSMSVSKWLEGSLPYLSPEQTGRMNRDLDYRSDYYSMGITLYELLTGKLPFTANTVLEWVHCHISKTPDAPHNVNMNIPIAVSKIIDKLISKSADDRYQSSIGLISDLENCQRQLAKSGKIGDFSLGKDDISETFQIPQRLFGRDKELSTLFQSFEKAAAGGNEICMISGFSGIGKSALVNEIHKPVVRTKGFFIKGKLDQFQRSSPYSAITSAFGELAQQLLSLPTEELEIWQSKLNETLGTSAQIILDIVPQFEGIIEKGPQVAPLPPTEAQNRLQIVFQQLIRQFASEEQPLVLFIDDLQWCDPPTLSLIQKLATSREISHFLLIGAYRDNEVGAGHPLQLMCDEVRKTKQINSLVLSPLSREDINKIIAGALHSSLESASNLTSLFYEKTEGNPFFLTELLKALNEDGYLELDSKSGEWTWDPKAIVKAKFGDSVVEFMVSNLRKLAPETQHALSIAACIGNSFDLNTLSYVEGKSQVETNARLHSGLVKGLIIPLDEDYRLVADITGNGEIVGSPANPHYKFQHDRVQQAAYALLDDKQKQNMHLSIGQLLRQHSSKEEQAERLTEIVDHLNRGRQLIVDGKIKAELMQLNLKAAIKARDAAAYELALKYCETGLELMGSDGWLTRYDEMLALKSEFMRCAYLWGEYDQSEQAAEDILANVKTPQEKASVLAMLTRQHATTGKMEQSIAAAIEGLKVLGIDFLDDPDEAALNAEIAAVIKNLNGRNISDLVNAPEITSPEKIIAIELLMEIFAAAFLSGSGTMFPYLVLKSVNLSLVHGNSPQSAFTYAAYGMLLCGKLNDPALGYEYGRLALAINERFDDIKLKSRVIYVYGMFVHHWSNHWSTLTDWFKKGIEAGYQSGDLLYLAYSAQDCIIWDPTLDLQTASSEQRKYLAIVRDCEYQDSFDSGSLFLQMLQNFQGLTRDRFSLTDDNFDEKEVFAGMLSRKFMTGIANYHIYKTEIHYFYDDYLGALEHIKEQDKLINSSMSLPQLVRYIFISFLTRTALFPSLNAEDQALARKILEDNKKQMTAWADNCEANFRHLQFVMEAELARIDGNSFDAINLFSASIELAGKSKFYRDEAMINELTGKHFINIGFAAAAHGYLQKAMVLYESWGANEKAAQLAASYPDVFITDIPAMDFKSRTHRTGSGTIDQNSIDLESVMKASHAISGEIVLSRLWETVMEILLENAGAQRGYFVWIRDGGMYLGAKAGNTPKNAIPSLVEPMKQEDAQSWLSTSIINYVVRSKEHVVLDDATQSERFSTDAYVLAERPKSVLCIPVSQSGQFVSAIYLENNLATGAFSEDRIEVLKLLAAQAAISIENAQLYDNLEAQVEARTKELRQKTNALERLSNQLSKYLSPQVYQSIFDSKQEARLVSARKRLTVFFSDIVGFTAAADRLESEELTQLLNHYLTEMSQIAIAYGATVDKFVGDAIVIFFGDPETQGNKDDALACVKMAIAMRAKMRDLISVWQSMGIEFPLHCRMGINTGYCTVGNFGSEDRMDYTIIGGTVNLAARLESAAQPDEILVSYETWALIKDEIHCEEMEPMKVKGISHDITTYRVIDLLDNIKEENKVVRTESKNVKLDMDIGKMSEAERIETARMLEDMVRRLSSDE